jgi:polysaccharide biosynthesis protein VpsM
MPDASFKVSCQVALGLLFLSTGAQAADGLRAHGLGDGMEAGIGLTASHTYHGNFFYQSSNKTAVEGLLLSPAVSLKQNFGRGHLALNAGAEIAQYDLPDDSSDYTDSTIVGSFRYDGGTRTAFSANLQSRRGHDPFGVDRTAGGVFANQELDKWLRNSVGGMYRYGAPTALLNFEIDAQLAEKDYTTNEPDTNDLDHQLVQSSQTLFVNYSPKTALLFEFGQTLVDFDSAAAADRDALELRLRTGVKWQATAKTQGDLRLGAMRRRLDDSGREAISGFSWAAEITWQPLARTRVQIDSSRRSQESFSQSVSVLDNRRHSLTLGQKLSENFRVSIEAMTGESRFVGSSRVDDLESYRLSLIYAVRDSVSVFAEARKFERDSTLNSLDFEAESGLIGLRLSP